MQNGCVESFNGRMRAVIAAWVADYNIARPHSALGYQTPAAAQTAPHGVTSLATG
jgi:transposase InsO family protein